MPKERGQINPATAALKSAKASSIKKQKALQTAARNEKLSKRNPNTIQRQVDELHALRESQGGTLKGREGKVLEGLERDLRVVNKSRLGTGKGGVGGDGVDVDGAKRGPRDEQRERRERMSGGADVGRGSRGGRGGAPSSGGSSMLGKRRRDNGIEEQDSASEDTDPDVRSIPMPRDSPPPLPRRPHRHASRDTDMPEQRGPHPLPARPGRAPVATPQTTYASAPQVRDLQREAVSRFMPAAVAARMKQVRQFQGNGGGVAGGGGSSGGNDAAQSQRLLEPEEVDRLEREGYLDANKVADEAGKERVSGDVAEGGARGAVDGDAGMGGVSLEDEEAAFERELREAELEQQGAGDIDVDAEDAEDMRHQVADAAKEDAREAAMAATEEDEHVLEAESVGARAVPDIAMRDEGNRKAQTQMRLVEVEDVSDDEW